MGSVGSLRRPKGEALPRPLETRTGPLLSVLALFLALLVVPPVALGAEHVTGEFDFRVPRGSTSAQIKGWIRETSAKYGLDPCLVQALIEIESGGNPAAVSPKGAQGLMQIMPGTAQDLKLKDSFDAARNIEAGTRYLRQLLDRFNGDVKLALAAYNAGPGTVSRCGGVPPIPETRQYIEKIKARYGKIG